MRMPALPQRPALGRVSGCGVLSTVVLSFSLRGGMWTHGCACPFMSKSGRTRGEGPWEGVRNRSAGRGEHGRE